MVGLPWGFSEVGIERLSTVPGPEWVVSEQTVEGQEEEGGGKEERTGVGQGLGRKHLGNDP